jgi:hypothetical protein
MRFGRRCARQIVQAESFEALEHEIAIARASAFVQGASGSRAGALTRMK